MEFFGTIGVLIAVVAIIWFSVKGLNIVIAAPLATLIVILTNKMDIFNSLVGVENSYIVSLAEFLINNFAIFLLGAILGQLMDETNSTTAIADWIISKTGTDNPYHVLVGIVIIGLILTYGGISIFVVMFAVLPMAKPIFKKLNINWELISIPAHLGMGTITLGCLPGSPSIHNAIPTSVLGTNLMAGWDIGIVAAIVLVTFGLIYMKKELNKSLAKGETFYSYLDEGDPIPEEDEVETSDLPSFISSIAPIVVLILMILFMGDVENILLIALTVAIILTIALHWKQIDDINKPLTKGANSSVNSAFATASSVAFGNTLLTAPGFEVIQRTMMSIPGSPIFSMALIPIVLSGITGSSSAAIGILINNYADHYLALGIAPEVIHRIVAIAANVLVVVPQSGVLITFNNIAGLKLKNSYKHLAIVVNLGHLLALIVAIAYALVVY